MNNFFEKQIVITPHELPAQIISVEPGGEIYHVNEMIHGRGFYTEDKLRLATDSECQMLGEKQLNKYSVGSLDTFQLAR